MITHLTKQGEAWTLEVDQAMLDRLGLDGQTRFEVSSDGTSLIFTPRPDSERGQAFHSALEKINMRYPYALKKLAE